MWKSQRLLTQFSSFSKSFAFPQKRTITLSSVHAKGKTRTGKAKVFVASSSKSSKTQSGAGMQQTTKLRKQYEGWRSHEQSLQGRNPLDDVYFQHLYCIQRFSVSDIVHFHREYVANPSMLNTPNAELHAEFTINCRTNKKNKFVQDLDISLLLPHPLTFRPVKNILAFCENPADMEAAKAQGALDAGGLDLITRLQQGQYHYESFDKVVCHTNFLKSLSKLRPLLRDKMPIAKTQSVGDDVGSLVHLFRNGADSAMTKLEGFPEIGKMHLCLGQLFWEPKQIEENLNAYVAAIWQDGAARVSGQFLEDVRISCPPSDESISVSLPIVEELKQMKVKKSASTLKQPVEKEGVGEEDQAETSTEALQVVL